MTAPRTFAADSLHDLTDAANLADAREAFRRARDQGGLSGLTAWAIQWGEAALAALEELQAAADGRGEAEGADDEAG
jgi:hypothetical protein